MQNCHIASVADIRDNVVDKTESYVCNIGVA